jgi:serine/threonine-protein kinase
MQGRMSDSSPTQLGTGPIETDVGTELGSYELVGLLGKGAMGTVYRARHVLLGREVAIKVLSPEYVARPEIVQRFFREARVVNDIDHEHIVEVTDFIEAPGLAYIVMELLEGASLRDLMAERGRKYPPVKRIVGLMSQLCEALEAAHAKGVVHRDLKPDNVFVVKRDGDDFVKVLDFGVAKLSDLDHTATSAGMILGTPHYMSPEQALGHEVDPHTDVWAAGVVLYELLSGQVPFTAPSFVELAMQIREQPPKPLPRRTPRGERIPPSVAAVVTRCLEKKPGDRFKSMESLAEALRTPRRRRVAVPRRWLAAAAAAAIVAAGIAFVALRPGFARQIGAAIRSSWKSVPKLAPTAPTSPPAQPERSAAVSGAESKAPPTPTSPPAHPERSAAAGGAESKGTPTKSSTRATPAPRTSTGPMSPQRLVATLRTVELILRSSPPGAAVVRLDTGQRLGKTPLKLNVARKEAVIWIQMRLEGHAPVKFAVDLRKDNTANVTFRSSAKTTKASRSRRR